MLAFTAVSHVHTVTYACIKRSAQPTNIAMHIARAHDLRSNSFSFVSRLKKLD